MESRQNTKMKIEKVVIGNKEHAEKRKAETRLYQVSSFNNVVCEAAYAPSIGLRGIRLSK